MHSQLIPLNTLRIISKVNQTGGVGCTTYRPHQLKYIFQSKKIKILEDIVQKIQKDTSELLQISCRIPEWESLIC